MFKTMDQPPLNLVLGLPQIRQTPRALHKIVFWLPLARALLGPVDYQYYGGSTLPEVPWRVGEDIAD